MKMYRECSCSSTPS